MKLNNSGIIPNNSIALRIIQIHKSFVFTLYSKYIYKLYIYIMNISIKERGSGYKKKKVLTRHFKHGFHGLPKSNCIFYYTVYISLHNKII